MTGPLPRFAGMLKSPLWPDAESCQPPHRSVPGDGDRVNFDVFMETSRGNVLSSTGPSNW